MVPVKSVIMFDQLRFKNSLWLLVAVVVILIDQLSKYAISQWLALGERWPLMPFVNLTLTHNQGAAFSFLSQDGGWQRWFLIGLAIIVSMIIIAYLLRVKAHHKLVAVSLALIVGGALGNVVDRVFNGYVIDFIDVYVGRWHWPVFNIADSCIVMGMILFIISSQILQVRQYDKNSSSR